MDHPTTQVGLWGYIQPCEPIAVYHCSDTKDDFRDLSARFCTFFPLLVMVLQATPIPGCQKTNPNPAKLLKSSLEVEN